MGLANLARNPASFDQSVNGRSDLGIIPEAEWREIAASYYHALSEAEQAAVAELNTRYFGIGDHFRDEFVEGLKRLLSADRAAYMIGSLKAQFVLHRGEIGLMSISMTFALARNIKPGWLILVANCPQVTKHSEFPGYEICCPRCCPNVQTSARQK